MVKLSHADDVCIFFTSEKKMKAREADCIQYNKCKVILPSENNRFLHFVNYKNRELVPTIVYADFECLIELEKRGSE